MLLASQRCAVRPAGASQAARLAPVRPSLRRISARASPTKSAGIDSDELGRKLERTASELKEKWDKTDDKPGAVLVISGTVIALSLAFSLVNAIDKIPIISDLIELVGIGVTGWFTYRYLTVGPDRDELFISIKDFIAKVYKF